MRRRRDAGGPAVEFLHEIKAVYGSNHLADLAGIPELEAKRYEGKVRAGNILISVHTENSEEIKRAKDIFTKAGAQDICTTGEASTPKDSKAADRGTRPAEQGLHVNRP